MVQIFGDYVEFEEHNEYLVMSFFHKKLSIQETWRANSLSADFLAGYWGTFFPVHDASSEMKRNEVQDSVNFIINELLENALKFSYVPANKPITAKLMLSMSQSDLVFYVVNGIDSERIPKFQTYIQKLLSEDTNEMYIQQMEENALHNEHSRLGLLSLINDYEAQLAWKFEESQTSGVPMLTTMVKLEIVRSKS